MTKFIPLILFTVLTNAAAQIMLKQGMMQVGSFEFASGAMFDAARRIILNPFIFLYPSG